MADNRTAQQRSETMRAVRSQDTQPEWFVRRLLHGLGYRYRLHDPSLPGKPDLVFAKRRKIVFVHGCFWHSHGCRYGQAPKSKLDYWLPKLAANKQRDREKACQLRSLGWSVITVWQCEIRYPERLTRRLQRFLGAKSG